MALTGGKNRTQRPISFDSGIVSIGDVSTRGFATDGTFIGQRVVCLNPLNTSIVAIGSDILAVDSTAMHGVVAIGEHIVLDSTGFNPLQSSVAIGGFTRPGIEGVSVGHGAAVPDSLAVASFNTAVGAFAIISGVGNPNPAAYNFCGGFGTIDESFNCVAIEGGIGTGSLNSVALAGTAGSGLGSATDCCAIGSAHIDGPNGNCVAMSLSTIYGNNYNSFAASASTINFNATFGNNVIAISSSTVDHDTTNTTALCGSTVGDTGDKIFAFNAQVGTNGFNVTSMSSSVVGNTCIGVFAFNSGVEDNSNRISSFMSALGLTNVDVFAHSSSVGNTVRDSFTWNSSVGDNSATVVGYSASMGTTSTSVFCFDGSVGNTGNTIVNFQSTISTSNYKVVAFNLSTIGSGNATVVALQGGVGSNNTRILASNEANVGDNCDRVFAIASNVGNTCSNLFVVRTGVPTGTVNVIGMQSSMGTGCADLVLMGAGLGINNTKINAMTTSMGDSNDSVVAFQAGVGSNTKYVFAAAIGNVGDHAYKVGSILTSSVGANCSTTFACGAGVPDNANQVVAFWSALGITNLSVFAGASGIGNRVNGGFAWNSSILDDVTSGIAIHASLGLRSSFSTVLQGFIGNDSTYCLAMSGATIGDFVDNGIIIGRGASVSSGTVGSHKIDPIAIGHNAVATGSYGIALGANSSANPNQFEVGNPATTGPDAINSFVIWGYSAIMSTNLPILTVLNEPTNGYTGLATTYNSAGVITTKIFKAAVSPPLGSLLVYMDP